MAIDKDRKRRVEEIRRREAKEAVLELYQYLVTLGTQHFLEAELLEDDEDMAARYASITLVLAP